ncbi:MAG: GNAT family N-acetyltransferase [Thermodesulfobacteriota bacterium]
MMTDQFPLEIILKDKTKLVCRPINVEDFRELEKFFRKVPHFDMEIFKDDVLKDEEIENWFLSPMNKKLVQLAVFKNKKIIADGTLHSEGLYWQKTGELKVIVDPEYRRQGIGSRMFNLLLHEGLKSGMQKLIIRFASDNNGVIKILDNYGFNPEVTLNYYLEDKEKNVHKDLIVASLNIQDWKRRFEFYRPFL